MDAHLFFCVGDIESVTLESLSGKHILNTVHSLSPKGRLSGEVGGERKMRRLQHRLVWGQSRVVLRAARGARTLSEFPLVSVLCFVHVCVSLSVSSLTFLSGTLSVSRQKACLASTSLP